MKVNSLSIDCKNFFMLINENSRLWNSDKTNHLNLNLVVCHLPDKKMILLINNKIAFQSKTNVTWCHIICISYHLIANCTYLITTSYHLVGSTFHKCLCSLINNSTNVTFWVFTFVFIYHQIISLNFSLHFYFVFQFR